MRHKHDDALVLDGMDWNNLVSWQHNSGYNASSAFPVPQGNYQQNPSSSQQFQHSPVNYMMPFPPEPLPAKIVQPVMSACFTRLGRWTLIPSASSSGSATIISSRHDEPR